MNPSGPENDLLNRLAEEFVERYRRGERPTPSEYIRQHPELADEIRELFPALVMMEQAATPGGNGNVTGLRTALDEGRTPQILGDYLILRQLGRGGMGVVYEAVQQSLGRHVALKVLPLHGAASDTVRERFQREAKAAARLHHTNIVPVFGVGEHEGVHYYAMQFIPGQGLDQVIKELRRLRHHENLPPTVAGPTLLQTSAAQALLTGEFAPVPAEPAAPLAVPAGEPSSSHVSWGPPSAERYYRSVARVALQVAEALEYAHRQGVLHRDIKPSNLLLDASGTIWVTDFGLARLEGSDNLTQAGDLVGTVRYMAPERFRGQSLPQGDVYGLGLTLYELLTLRPAFDDTSRAELIEHILHHDPAPPRRLAPTIPRDLETIVQRASARDPGDRYASAAALAEDLRNFLEDRPIKARRSSVLEQTWRWCRRSPALASLTAAVALLVVLTAVGAGVTALWLHEDNLRISAAHTEADRHAQDAERNFADAQRNAQELAAARQQEVELRRQAEAGAAQSKRQLARLCVADALRHLDEGDSPTALLWLAEALKQDAPDPSRTETHRARFHSVLAATPRLLQLWTHEDPVYTAALSPDGHYAVVAEGRLHFVSPPRGAAHVYDTRTGERVALLPHPLPVQFAAFVDNRRIVTACTGYVPAGERATRTASEVRLWEAPSGKPLTPPLKSDTGVKAAHLSPDGRRLFAVLGMHNQWLGVQAWDLGNNAVAGPAVRHNRGHHISLSPDCSRVVVGSWNSAEVLDAATGKQVFGPLEHGLKRLRGGGGVRGGVNHTAFSDDGKWLLTASADETARVWDGATGQPLTPPLRHTDQVNHAAFSPGPAPQRVATASDDGTACLWDIKSGELVLPPIRHHGHVVHVAFSPDGKKLLTISGDAPLRPSDTTGYTTVRLWDALTGEPAGPVLRHTARVTHAGFSTDGRWIITTDMDGLVRLWSVADAPARVVKFPAISPISNAAVSADLGRAVVKNVSGRAALWDLSKDRSTPLAEELSGYVQHAVFSPNGSLLATANGMSPWGPLLGFEKGKKYPDQNQARIWDAVTGALLARLEHSGNVNLVVFSPDGARVVTTSYDHQARVWEARTGKAVTPWLKHDNRVFGAAFSPDGKRVLTASWDHTVRLWDAATGESAGPTLAAGRSPYLCTYSPDGRWVLTAGYDRIARLWDAATGKLLAEPVSHGGHVTGVWFGEETCRIIVVRDQSARVWDVRRGTALTPLWHHGGQVTQGTFSGTGRWVATASDDGKARVWDVASGEPLTPWLRHGPAISAGHSFGPIGRTDVPRAVLSADGRALVLLGRESARRYDLSLDSRPTEDLVKLAELLSGQATDGSGGATPLGKAALIRTWQLLRAKYPEAFRDDTSPLAWAGPATHR
jgi:WD40 repeat protein/serine/threonine protein kinase